MVIIQKFEGRVSDASEGIVVVIASGAKQSSKVNVCKIDCHVDHKGLLAMTFVSVIV